MANWEAIRSLDEEENWSERNSVLSKTNHVELMEVAKVIVEDLIYNLPIATSPTTQPNSEFDYMKDFTDDDFKYSAAQFDMDYLEKISSEGNSNSSDLARESLYVKFDPLVSRQSPKTTSGKANRNRSIPKSDGDLLLLGTPPQSNRLTEIKTAASSSQASLLSPLTSTATAASHPASQPVAVPETADLVDVLKYSEDDLPEILEAARKVTMDYETEKYESQVRLLRGKILNTRQQLQQNNKKKDTFQAKTVLLNTSNEKIEQDLNNHREKLKSHLKRESEIQVKHDELKKDVAELEEQLELIMRDSTSLENAFDKLHQRYIKQKAVYQCLFDRNKAIQQYTAGLKAWNQQDCESKEEIRRELHVLEQRAEEAVESIRKEHTSRMTVERAKAVKLKMQMDNLDRVYKQKEEEKQQVSQICEELMRELETMR